MAILAVLVAVVSAVLTAVLFIFVAFTVYLLVMHRRYAHIPQPKRASFYMGHLSAFKQGRFGHDQFLEWCHEVGPVFVAWFVHVPILMVADPECVKRLSSRDVSKPRVPAIEYLFGQRFVLRSVLTIQHYDDWKDRRRRFDISFSRSHLNSLVPQFNKVAREHFIDKLRTKADGQTMVDLLNEFGNTTLQMISTVAFGTDFSKDQYVQSLAGDKGLTYLMSHCLEGLMKILINPLLMYARFGKNLSYAEAALKVRQIGEYCIRKRLAALENKQEVPNDILTLILQTVQIEKNVDMDELVDDFVTFYLAGQETTANLLSFSIVLLLQHPDILGRVMEEIDEVVGDKTSVDADDLDKLTYMNQVFQEVLRLYPPAPAVSKQAFSGLKLGNLSIPSGSEILILSYVTHHLPEYHHEPFQFNPSRFDPDQKRPSPYVYFPFGIGHRSCIGRVFAIMEAKVLLVHLLKTFHVTLAHDYKLEVKQAVTICPKGGVPCTLVAKDHK